MSDELTSAAGGVDPVAKLTGDKEWAAKFLSGAPQQARELKEALDAKQAGTDRIDRIIAGTEKVPMLEVVAGGQLSTFKQIQAASWLKETGIPEAAIKQVFEGKPVSRGEYAAAVEMRKRLMDDPEWSRAYLSGRREHVQQMNLLNIIHVLGPAEDAA